MWLFLKYGFYGVVEDRHDKSGLLIRARAKHDLPRLRDAYMPTLAVQPVKETQDYPYHARISKVDFGTGLAKAALDVDYDKVKPVFQKFQGSFRHGVAMQVWTRMLDIQDTPSDYVSEHRILGAAKQSSEAIGKRLEEKNTILTKRKKIKK